MNDDLKAYVDGELPPDAADRLRAALEADPDLADELAEFRSLSRALNALPEPEVVGMATTLAALQKGREPLFRNWSLALAGCAAVLAAAAFFATPHVGLTIQQVKRGIAPAETAPVEVTLPTARRNAFTRFVQQRGGEVHRDAEGLRATYSPNVHAEILRRFDLPESTPWPAEGLRVRLEP